MKSLKYRLKKQEVTITNTDWNKYDDRLMKAVERGEVDKASAVISKKGVIPTKLDVEGRSAFHLAASRGQLDCLNVILGHNVDITASDAAGKNALHLAARNGHSQCVQKLLQHNCPVGNVDLQGRTALHDAVLAGCSSSVKLLCDSGAPVNASDFDGRTPLILATQICHPQICQLLLERGADTTVRDKQNKTPLMLGCEFGCNDSVEVLLKTGVDVKAVDNLGHDAFYYARLSNKPELVAMVKSYLEKATREKEAAKVDHWKRQLSVERSKTAESNRKDQVIQELERSNETLQENLRKHHQEQKLLMEKYNLLQQQLTQEKTAAGDALKEKEQLKVLLGAKEKEEGARGLETVKVQHRSTMGDYSGQSVIKGKENILVKQAHSLESDQNAVVSRRLLRSPTKADGDVSGEVEALRCELEVVKRRQQAAEEDTARLQAALTRKNRECQELVESRDSIQKQADRQVQELEDALGDVQKRMLDSECKVKQLQAHVVAVKEHLDGQASEEVRVQLLDVKSKYEGASAEVGRVRNRLKQSEKALEEYKSSESQLAAENERLNQELEALTAERDVFAQALVKMEAQVKESQTKQVNTVSAEKFDNMKNLLTNAVDEKERQLAELREDYDRVLEEVADLHRKLDSPSVPSGAVSADEHSRIVAALEEQNTSLKRKLMDVTTKSQDLIQDLEENEDERDVLREQLDELNSRMEKDYIPMKHHEEMRKNMVTALEELEDKLVEASERYGKAEAQVQQIQTERTTLLETINNFKDTSKTHQREVDTLKSQNTELTKTLDLLQKRCEDGDKEREQLMVQNQSLRQSVKEQFVPKQQHEQVKVELSSTVERMKAEMVKMETREKESSEELKNVREGKGKLKEQLEKVMLEMKTEFLSVGQHRSVTDRLNAAVVEAENRANEASAKHALALEETAKLALELEAQKKELDTIQEAIQSKFVPLTAAKEKETSHSVQVKELTEKLLEMEEKYNKERCARESFRQEKEKLQADVEYVQQKLDSVLVTSEKHNKVEEEFKSKYDVLTQKMVSLEQELQQVTLQKTGLEEENALHKTQIQSLQERLKSELTRIATYDSELKTLHDIMQQAQADCKRAREAQQEEAQRACVLQSELQELNKDQSSLLQQHTKTKDALEAEVAKLQMSLREEEENNAQRAEDVFALQSELLQATQALEEIRHKEDQMNRLNKEKQQQLEEEATSLSSKLQCLSRECEEAHLEARQAREGEERARTEVDAVQEKGRAVEREIRELKERYDESLSTICDLQKRVQMSAQQTEAKDKKITELLTDVERLKQALNGLSQLAYTSNTNKRHLQQIDALQAQIKSLQQQLADAERQHRDVVSIYRTHLLSAAQGHMDADVQAALLQIIRMRQEFLC